VEWHVNIRQLWLGAISLVPSTARKQGILFAILARGEGSAMDTEFYADLRNKDSVPIKFNHAQFSHEDLQCSGGIQVPLVPVLRMMMYRYHSMGLTHWNSCCLAFVNLWGRLWKTCWIE